MAQNDFYIDAAITRANTIEAELAAARADLAAHRANGDTDSAGVSIQQIANLESERANLNNLYAAYVQSQQPPQPEQLTDEERMAKPWSRMDWSDVVEMTRGSKWAKDIKADDPNMIAGWREAQRRRARGE